MLFDSFRHRMKRILYLKAKVLWRALKEMPVAAIIIFAVIVCALFWGIYKAGNTAPYNYYIAGAYLLILMSIQSTRKDYHLCRQIVAHPYIHVCVEYMILSIPFISISIIANAYPIALIYTAIPFIIAAFPKTNILKRQRSLPLPFKMPSLESVSFFRKYGIIVLPLLALSAILCFATGISVVIVYFLILFYAGTAFAQSESLSVLSLDELPPKQLLRKKCRGDILLWMQMIAPAIVLYIPFNLDTAYYVLVPIILGPPAICSSVFIKYSNYSPKKHLFGTISQALCMMGYIIPVLLPLTLIMTLMYRSDAIDNLSQYLDAYNQ